MPENDDADAEVPLGTDEASPAKATARKGKPRKEPIGLRVSRSGADVIYAPATASDAERLKPANHAHGDLVFVDFRKPRNPGFHRLAHAIGKLAVENIDDLSHLEAHAALKRLQVESGAGCEEMLVEMRSIWPDIFGWIRFNLGDAAATVLKMFFKETKVTQKMIVVRVPKSLSYDSMDEIEFHATIKAICTYMANRYWPSLSPEEIENMAQATKDLTT